MSDYFKRSTADGAVFIELVKRYGVKGTLEALANVVGYHERDERMCSNKCTVSSNVGWEIRRAAREIENWNKDAGS